MSLPVDCQRPRMEKSRSGNLSFVQSVSGNHSSGRSLVSKSSACELVWHNCVTIIVCDYQIKLQTTGKNYNVYGGIQFSHIFYGP